MKSLFSLDGARPTLRGSGSRGQAVGVVRTVITLPQAVGRFVGRHSESAAAAALGGNRFGFIQTALVPGT